MELIITIWHILIQLMEMIKKKKKNFSKKMNIQENLQTLLLYYQKV